MEGSRFGNPRGFAMGADPGHHEQSYIGVDRGSGT
jgi:hypothetical protein